MKKPNCRRTDDEKRVHDKAVRLRNMTDAQLVELFDSTANNCYADGLRDGLNHAPTLGEVTGGILAVLEDTPGLGKATISKIKTAFDGMTETDEYGEYIIAERYSRAPHMASLLRERLEGKPTGICSQSTT